LIIDHCEGFDDLNIIINLMKYKSFGLF